MAKRQAKPTMTGGPFDYIAKDLRPLAVPIDELTIDPRNARTHDEQNLTAICASLSEFGLVKPIVADRKTKQIVAGNGTFAAAKRLGWTHLAVVWVEQSAAARTGYALADNRTAELAGWDQIRLAELLVEVSTSSPDLHDALLLSELVAGGSAGAPGGSDGDEESTPDDYGLTLGVLIKCRDKAQQRRWFDRARKEGVKCRRLRL